MNKKKILGLTLAFGAIIALSTYYFINHPILVLDPKGPIALKERNLFYSVFGLMLIVVVPVFIMLFVIVYRYRDGHKGKYRPDFDHSRLLESIWWLIPSILIGIIAVMTWQASYQLDPYRPIASKESTLNVQVIALDWKWLFIYPKQNIATVNQLVIPINHPIAFNITADAPMNSFWIPQLSGQIYAMAGMSTHLNLMATSPGNYYGSSANISGLGFSGMHFMTKAVSNGAFTDWVNLAGHSKQSLTDELYKNLAKPSSNYPVSYYKNPDNQLFSKVIYQYMPPSMSSMPMMGMN